MTYLLLIALSAYIMLATFAFQRQPQSVLHRLLTATALAAALTTAGYLVLGTTADRTAAQIAALVVVVSGGLTVMALLPLTLLALLGGTWFADHRHTVFEWALRAQGTVLAAVVVVYLARPFPLAVRVNGNYWQHWMLLEAHLHWTRAAALVLASQIPLAAVIGLAVRRQSIPIRRGALPLIALSVTSVLLPALAPLTGGPGAVLVAALGLTPLVSVCAWLVLRRPPLTALDKLIESHLRRYNEGLVILDARNRVVWHNAQARQWFAPHPRRTLPQLVDTLLHGTLLLAPVRYLLSGEDTSTSCEWMEGGTEIALRLELHPLDQVRDLPRARLLVIRAVPSTRTMLTQQAQRAELLVLSAISADIASSLDLDQVITRALQQTQVVVDADMAVIYLVDTHDPARLARAGQIMRDSAEQHIPQAPPSLPVTDTIAGWVIANAKSFFVPDAEDDAEHGARLAQHGLRAGATVPVLARNRVIGVLQVGMCTPHHFDPVTVTLIESVGRQLGIAIDNARLHHEERHQRRVAEVLSRVAGILTTQSVDRALQSLLDQLQGLLAYTRASILLLDEPGMLSVSAHAGFKDVPEDGTLSDVQIRIADYPYLQTLFEKRLPQLVADTASDPRWLPGDYQFGSWIGVPLVIHDQVLGCLTVAHHRAYYFDQTHLQLAATFADQAVIAVENARLFEAEQRRRQLAEFLQRTSFDLVMSPDLDSALSTALAHFARALHFDSAHFGLLDEMRKVWIARVSYPADTPPQHGKELPVDYFPLITRLLQERELIYVPETRDEPLWVPDPPDHPEIRSWIGVPLIARDTLIGLLNFYSLQPHHFSGEDLYTTRMFANQTAAALDNFRLLDQTSRQNQMLSALNTVLSASNEALAGRDNVLAVSLMRLLDTLGLTGGAIHRLDAHTRVLRLQSAAGLPQDVVREIERVSVQESLEAQVLPPVTDADGTTRAFVSVPLIANARAIGLLSIVGPLDADASGDLRVLLSGIGQQLGVVMENAMLFETTTQRAALSTDLNRLSLAISAQLDRDTVLRLLCDESLGVFDVQGAYIWLVADAYLTGVAASGIGADRFEGHRVALNDDRLLPVQVLDRWQPRAAQHITSSSTDLPADFLAWCPARSALAIPLLKADVPIGIMMLVNTQDPEAFSNWPLDQIGVLGVQAALAIQNALLYQEAQQRLDQLRLVNETSRYTTAILSPIPLIEGVTQKIVRTLNYDLVSLIEVTAPDTLAIQTVVFRDQTLSDDAIAPLSDTLLAHAEDAAHIAAPIQHNTAYPLADVSASVFCALAVPMIIADEVTGVVLVARQHSDSITNADLDVLQPLAAQLAISISNARLYEKVRQQTLALEARVAARTAEIRRQHERTEAILRSVADAVIVFDMQAKVVMTNPVARALFDQFDLRMDLGTRVRALVAPILSGSHDGHDPTEIFEAGLTTLQAKAAPVVDDESTLGAVVIIRDITRLSELDRMKDLFVSNVSHELRTPMANLKLYLTLLEQGRPERRDKYRDVMKREVERLERLISDLLEISRLKNEQRAEHTQTRQPLDLEALINAVVEGNVAVAQAERKYLSHECADSPLPQCHGDPDQIVRALTNLVSNALRYTPEGGRVTVRSHTSSHASGHAAPESVIIEVVDTGIGIPESEQAVIFERFYRGSNISPTISGTGLGLAIVKEIVDLHAGQLEVESVVGHGSTFRMTLPVYTSSTFSDTAAERA